MAKVYHISASYAYNGGVYKYHYEETNKRKAVALAADISNKAISVGGVYWTLRPTVTKVVDGVVTAKMVIPEGISDPIAEGDWGAREWERN